MLFFGGGEQAALKKTPRAEKNTSRAFPCAQMAAAPGFSDPRPDNAGGRVWASPLEPQVRTSLRACAAPTTARLHRRSLFPQPQQLLPITTALS